MPINESNIAQSGQNAGSTQGAQFGQGPVIGQGQVQEEAAPDTGKRGFLGTLKGIFSPGRSEAPQPSSPEPEIEPVPSIASTASEIEESPYSRIDHFLFEYSPLEDGSNAQAYYDQAIKEGIRGGLTASEAASHILDSVTPNSEQEQKAFNELEQKYLPRRIGMPSDFMDGRQAFRVFPDKPSERIDGNGNQPTGRSIKLPSGLNISGYGPRDSGYDIPKEEEVLPIAIDSRRSTYDKYVRDSYIAAHKKAMREFANAREAWVKADPWSRTADDYISSYDYTERDKARFLEAFANEIPSFSSLNAGLDETVPRRDRYGRRIVDDITHEPINDPKEPVAFGIERPEISKKDKTIDRVQWQFKVGILPVESAIIALDQTTGKKSLKWRREEAKRSGVENAMKETCAIFGWDPKSDEAYRNIGRLVMCRASLGSDTKGKTFDQESDVWQLSDKEIIKILVSIQKMCMKYGNPFAIDRAYMPGGLGSDENLLRGTQMIPVGYVPDVLAIALTGPNSSLNHDGVKTTAEWLKDDTRERWRDHVLPWMNENLIEEPDRESSFVKRMKEKKVGRAVKTVTGAGMSVSKPDEEKKHASPVAQKKAVLYFNEAMTKLDGMTSDKASTYLGVDMRTHYSIGEVIDMTAAYAVSPNGNYDASKVVDYQRKLGKHVEENLARNKNKRERTLADEIMNIVAVGIKTNSLFWQIPIILSAIPEKGVGNLQTHLALKWIQHRTGAETGVGITNVSEELMDAMKTPEGVDAMDAALIVMEIAGPEGLIAFANSGSPFTKAGASAFLKDTYIPQVSGTAASAAEWMNERLSNIQRKMLTGDWAWRKTDAMNFLNALLVSNQVLIGLQNTQGKTGKEVGFTGNEFNEAFLSHDGDISKFVADVMKTTAGREALMMMRWNNVGNFNPLSYSVDRMLREHSVTNAMVLTYVDAFPKYGINYLYTLCPMSRTLSFVAMMKAELREQKRRSALENQGADNGDKPKDKSGDGEWAGLFTPGGTLVDMEGIETLRDAYRNDPVFKKQFQAAARMNMIFDAVAIGRNLFSGLILGALFHILGFGEPPDKDDRSNVSKWTIGGEEVQYAFWLNDLTQLGLPNAYAFAAFLNGEPLDVCADLWLDSLRDQTNGNVVYDLIDLVKNFGSVLFGLDQAANDPDFAPEPTPSVMLLDLALTATDKIAPGAPLFRWLSRDSFSRGDLGLAHTPYKTFDLSSDWAIEEGVTKYVDDPHELILRKHSQSNIWLGLFLDHINSIIHPDGKFTGYQWWEMPVADQQDPLSTLYAAQQRIDHETFEGFDNELDYYDWKTDLLLDQVDSVIREYGGPESAAMNGYIMLNDARKVIKISLDRREAQLEAELDAVAAIYGERSDQWWRVRDAVKKEEDKIWYYRNLLLTNDSKIPAWHDSYARLLSDWDVTYYDADGNHINGMLYLISPGATREWKLSGNSPTTLWPYTTTRRDSSNMVRRGFDGETIANWATEGTDLDKIRSTIGQQEIESGKYAGMTGNEILFGMDENGELLHPDEPTVGRALIPKQSVPDEELTKWTPR